jgi:hypothetical protein
MPLPKRKIRLQLDPAADRLASGKRLSDGMSAAASFADTLWLAHDETNSIERLRAEKDRTGDIRYASHRRFDLRDLVAFPKSGANRRRGPTAEADLEGLAVADGYLWVTGSHSVVRETVTEHEGPKAIAALANVRRDGNRFLLARLPMQPSAEGPVLVPEFRAGDGRTLRAARLPGGRKHDALTRLLRTDAHLAPFLSIPSKDNGFDIEGLAAAPDGRLFLGLRGPVIDGWACVLEIVVGAHSSRKNELVLRKLRDARGSAQHGNRYRKHFLDLGGAGIRDLCLAGRDLLILAGPPMRGNGEAHVHRWKSALAVDVDTIIGQRKLPKLLELPYGETTNHPEGITIVAQRGQRAVLMAIYDSIEKDKRVGAAAMWATLHTVVLR